MAKEIDFNSIDRLQSSPIRKYLDGKDQVITLFEDERSMLKEVENIINVSYENLRQPLKAVVLGEVKAGKSTLVNALVGKQVSYMNVVEATAAIIEINYSESDKITILFKNGEQQVIHSLDDYEKIIEKNKDNQEFFGEISKIKIETNTDRLKSITLVDTPGLNTITTANEERTENYIINSDVVIWVLNAHHLGQNDIQAKIEEIMDFGKPIICVLNRIDEVNGDHFELIEFVQNEMGYAFAQIFAISAKRAWDGLCENNLEMIQNSNIESLIEFIKSNIERDSKEYQVNTLIETIKVQLAKDHYIHRTAKLKITNIIEKLETDMKEIKRFHHTLKQITDNRVNEWLETRFFEEEKQMLINCGDDNELKYLAKQYFSDEYINKTINNKYLELSDFIYNEWSYFSEDFINKQTTNELLVLETLSTRVSLTPTDSSDNKIGEGIKQGGITAGAVGLGLAGYAAWLGPAAAYVSIGSAMAAFIPPLAIAGAVGGIAWKLMAGDKSKEIRYNQINSLSIEAKNTLRNTVLGTMKQNLYKSSDRYYENSMQVIMSILSQCNITVDELEIIRTDLAHYLSNSSDYSA